MASENKNGRRYEWVRQHWLPAPVITDSFVAALKTAGLEVVHEGLGFWAVRLMDMGPAMEAA